MTLRDDRTRRGERAIAHRVTAITPRFGNARARTGSPGVSRIPRCIGRLRLVIVTRDASVINRVWTGRPTAILVNCFTTYLSGRFVYVQGGQYPGLFTNRRCR
jgi:hypothetical protein